VDGASRFQAVDENTGEQDDGNCGYASQLNGKEKSKAKANESRDRNDSVKPVWPNRFLISKKTPLSAGAALGMVGSPPQLSEAADAVSSD